MALMIDKDKAQRRETQKEERVVESRGVDHITQYVRPLDESTIATIQINPIGSELELHIVGRGRYDHESKSFKTITAAVFTRKRLIALRDFLNSAHLDAIFRMPWETPEYVTMMQKALTESSKALIDFAKNFNLETLTEEEGEKPGESSLSPEEKNK